MWVLLDGSAKRTSFLSAAVEALGLSPRVEVASGRAEELGRGPLRGTIDLVVARSFAAPAATAECAAGFLRVGGQLLVAEPPGGAPERWASEALDLLGLAIGRSSSQPTALQILDQVRPCPDRYPRRVGVPSKRPLF